MGGICFEIVDFLIICFRLLIIWYFVFDDRVIKIFYNVVFLNIGGIVIFLLWFGFLYFFLRVMIEFVMFWFIIL